MNKLLSWPATAVFIAAGIVTGLSCALVYRMGKSKRDEAEAAGSSEEVPPATKKAKVDAAPEEEQIQTGDRIHILRGNIKIKSVGNNKARIGCDGIIVCDDPRDIVDYAPDKAIIIGEDSGGGSVFVSNGSSFTVNSGNRSVVGSMSGNSSFCAGDVNVGGCVGGSVRVSGNSNVTINGVNYRTDSSGAVFVNGKKVSGDGGGATEAKRPPKLITTYKLGAGCTVKAVNVSGLAPLSVCSRHLSRDDAHLDVTGSGKLTVSADCGCTNKIPVTNLRAVVTGSGSICATVVAQQCMMSVTGSGHISGLCAQDGGIASVTGSGSVRFGEKTKGSVMKSTTGSGSVSSLLY